MREKTGETVFHKTKKYSIHTIRPCRRDASKIMAEAKLRLKKPISMSELKAHLRKKFKKVQYAPNIRAARIDWEGKIIILFDSGEMYVREAKNERDILETVQMIDRTIRA